MNFSELIREAKAIIQDASPTILVSLPDYVNEAVQQIAEEIKFPELRQVVSVSTSISLAYVNMPTGWSSRLKYAGNSNSPRWSVLFDYSSYWNSLCLLRSTEF